MQINRAKELLRNVVENLLNANGLKKGVMMLIGEYGFEPEELVRDFGVTSEDMELVTGVKIKDTIMVTVYRDTCDPGFNGDDNIAEIEVDRAELFKFFVNMVASDSANDATSDEDRFAEWLDSYTADDTDGLYDYIGGFNSGSLKQFFVDAYNAKSEKLTESFTSGGAVSPSYEAKVSFDEYANADELVGYYISHYGDDAFKTWLTSSTRPNAMIADKVSEVTRILKNLYGTGCYGAGSEACLNFCTGCSCENKEEEERYKPTQLTDEPGYDLPYAIWDKEVNTELVGTDGTMFLYKTWDEAKKAADDLNKELKAFHEQEQAEYEAERNSRFDNGYGSYIYFDVKICLDADFLLNRALKRDGYDIAQDVKDTVMQTEYYCEQIHKEMEERNILSEYIDLFDCADTDVIIDKYCNIDTESITFDYDEAACSVYDRNQCWFKVPVSFNLEKYIRVMDQGNEEASA